MTKLLLLEWFDRQVELLTQDFPPFLTTNHLDEIDASLIDGTHDLRNGLDALVEISRLAENRLPNIVVALIIDLGWTDRLNTEAPDLKEMSKSPSAFHAPPSLYLFTLPVFAPPTGQESYRSTYDSTPWGPEYAAEYECARTLPERSMGWEFGSAVWIHASKQLA